MTSSSCVFQVSQLYDVVQKWDVMATSLPQVVQRLTAVKELHEQGILSLHPLFQLLLSAKYNNNRKKKYIYIYPQNNSTATNKIAITYYIITFRIFTLFT